MLEHLLKQGLSVSEARRRIKATIENTINNLQTSDNKVSPLLNKLADVTLTKCSENLPSSIRKRPVISKQRDWPEKKIIKDEPGTEIAKIEERNPEVLAKKILAQGRNLENKAKILSPRKSSSENPPPAVEVRRIPENKMEYPKYDIGSSLNNELVLPSHPRSRSSEQTEDVPTYHTNKMSSAPRAEQFEDRLKTIIHSVIQIFPFYVQFQL